MPPKTPRTPRAAGTVKIARGGDTAKNPMGSKNAQADKPGASSQVKKPVGTKNMGG